jgi:hypothetical protein
MVAHKMAISIRSAKKLAYKMAISIRPSKKLT